MPSTSGKKAPNKRSRRSRPGLHHFMLWALITWFLQRAKYRKTNNPFAAPASRRKSAPKKSGGGGGAGGGGADPRPKAKAKASRPAAAAKPAPVYREGAGGDDIDAEVMDDVADEDVVLEDDPIEVDDVEIFETPRAAIGGMAS